ncbi:hypothetical protein SAMN02982929_03535 [Saccharopolyspora kobensis]|uniref:Uncharacterized protein n=1 Tax=Saccharopolyspora kobensis TaxID=146035 RepID=A0A1H6CTU8_9PSEU|nr:hypothetical protein [Saccharopolyspora kobensis]SEG76384.1 hypothetical protein SAMN02982929_03535 [Saccharopolyspora kobensis]SFC99175.1 hypothetical protein SAMN05216506_102129 [Saccharopolyspora kobensis]
MSKPWSLLTLPGPRKHLESISAVLDNGMSCVWLIPDEFVKNGFADDLLDELAIAHDSVHIPAPEETQCDGGGRAHAVVPTLTARPTNDLPAWAQDTFSGLAGFDAPTSSSTVAVAPRTTSVAERIVQLLGLQTKAYSDEIHAIVAEPLLHGKVLVVRGWREQDRDSLASVLTRLTSLVKEEGLQPEHRPRILLATRENDLPRTALDRLDQMTTRVRWWWGAVGRLDTAVVVASARPKFSGKISHASSLREIVALDVITEVAGPDLWLAEHLAVSWDGLISSLGDEIEAATRDLTGECHHVGVQRGHSGNRPPHELRPLWRLAMADLWEHQLRVSPAANRPKRDGIGLNTLIWRGQNRALMPIVDEYRGQIEMSFRKRASQAVLTDVTQQEGPRKSAPAQPRRTVLELGAMAWAISSRRVRLTQADNELLFSLLDVRNSLAHLQPITDEMIERLAHALPGERH